MLSGRVIGAHAGPPCESWAAVREIAIDVARHGPRPLRSRAEPWGLKGLSRRELQQVHIGNLLLTFSLDIVAALVQTKGFASLEHPAKSARSSSAASIWDLEDIKVLLSVPGAEQVDFCQDIHGASSRKPTTLLVLRMPPARSASHIASRDSLSSFSWFSLSLGTSILSSSA